MCFQPLTITCSRPFMVTIAGVLHVGTSARGVRHNSLPLRTSNAATNDPFCTSACKMTRPLWITGELAKPHCASGTMKKPESSVPNSFCHSSLPFMS
jgi:hypothetical protein